MSMQAVHLWQTPVIGSSAPRKGRRRLEKLRRVAHGILAELMTPEGKAHPPVSITSPVFSFRYQLPRAH